MWLNTPISLIAFMESHVRRDSSHSNVYAFKFYICISVYQQYTYVTVLKRYKVIVSTTLRTSLLLNTLEPYDTPTFKTNGLRLVSNVQCL